jgi:Uma2 family endonuclease
MCLPKSEAEYLALERDSEERHEYLDGLIYAVAGESLEHGAICTNIVGQVVRWRASSLRCTRHRHTA